MAKIPEEWSKHLTPELREHFGRIGEELVRYDVSEHRYGTPEKHGAALAWLAERRVHREYIERCRYWSIFIVAVLTLVAATIAIL